MDKIDIRQLITSLYDNKTKTVATRVSYKFYELLESQLNGKTMSEFMRDCILFRLQEEGNLEKVIDGFVTRDEVAEAIAEIVAPIMKRLED